MTNLPESIKVRAQELADKYCCNEAEDCDAALFSELHLSFKAGFTAGYSERDAEVEELVKKCDRYWQDELAHRQKKIDYTEHQRAKHMAYDKIEKIQSELSTVKAQLAEANAAFQLSNEINRKLANHNHDYSIQLAEANKRIEELEKHQDDYKTVEAIDNQIERLESQNLKLMECVERIADVTSAFKDQVSPALLRGYSYADYELRDIARQCLSSLLDQSREVGE